MQFVVFSEGFKFKTILYKLCTTNYTAGGTNLKFVFILQGLVRRLLKSQPHLVPCDAAVDGGADAFVLEAEFRIVREELVFAGQDQALSSLLPGVGNGRFQELPGIAMAAARRQGIDAENHLPGPLFVMHGRLSVHGVSQIPFIRHHAVDEGHEVPLFIEEQPEMGRIMGQAVPEFYNGPVNSDQY